MPVLEKPAPDAHDLAASVRRGERAPIDLVEEAIARIEGWDGHVNAVIHRRFAAARREAQATDPSRQPFAGVPLLIKDSGAQMAGEPHHEGVRPLAAADARAKQDSWLVERLRAAGFVILGRTNVPELTSLPVTEPAAYGPTRNPWDLDHSPGGSSGGSAAAVAAGFAPVAHASDGGGSTRVPASCCGLVGLKPSRGRLTRGPQEGVAWGGLSIDGFVTRSVRDTAAVLAAVMGPGPGDPEHAPAPRVPLDEAPAAFPGARTIGVRTEAFAGSDPTHPEIVRAVERTADALEALGHRVAPGGPEALDDPEISRQQGRVVAVAQAVRVERIAERLGRPLALDELEPMNAAVVRTGRALSALDHARAIDALHAYTRRVALWFETHDLLLLPTLTAPPPMIGEIRGDATPEQLAAVRRRYGWLTPPWNITGQPAISLPVAVSEAGLPLGVQLVAKIGREDLLIQVAAQLEARLGWRKRVPDFGPWRRDPPASAARPRPSSIAVPGSGTT